MGHTMRFTTCMTASAVSVCIEEMWIIDDEIHYLQYVYLFIKWYGLYDEIHYMRDHERGKCVHRSDVDTHTYTYTCTYTYTYIQTYTHLLRGGGLGSSTIFKNLMSPTPRRIWYLTTGCRAH